MTDARQPRVVEPMTWYQGQMIPRAEYERARSAEAAPDTPSLPRGVAPSSATTPTPDPTPVTSGRNISRPASTSSAAMHLIEGIGMEITAAPGGEWVTRFTRDGETLTEDRNGTEPWVDRRAPGRLAAMLREAVPALDQKVIRDAINTAFEEIRSTPDGRALMSEPTARAIDSTSRVTVERCDPPVYQVDLIDGGTLTFTAREMAALQPITLNERWLSAHPRDPLDAKSRDFREIRQYWFSIAEEVEPAGNASPWEGVTERLQRAIAPREVTATKDGLATTGLYQEQGGPLWISGRVIADVLKEAGKGETDSGFSKYLRKNGFLVAPSRTHRVGQMVIRAWGFDPGFLPDAEGICESVDLSPIEEGT